MPYLCASAVVIHYEEALYQVYAALPLPLTVICFWCHVHCSALPSARLLVDNDVMWCWYSIVRQYTSFWLTSNWPYGFLAWEYELTIHKSLLHVEWTHLWHDFSILCLLHVYCECCMKGAVFCCWRNWARKASNVQPTARQSSLLVNLK